MLFSRSCDLQKIIKILASFLQSQGVFNTKFDNKHKIASLIDKVALKDIFLALRSKNAIEKLRFLVIVPHIVL